MAVVAESAMAAGFDCQRTVVVAELPDCCPFPVSAMALLSPMVNSLAVEKNF